MSNQPRIIKSVSLPASIQKYFEKQPELSNFSSWVVEMLEKEFGDEQRIEKLNKELTQLSEQVVQEKKNFFEDPEIQWLFNNRDRFSNDHWDGMFQHFLNSTGSEKSKQEVKFYLDSFKKNPISDGEFVKDKKDFCPVCERMFSEFVPKFAFSKSINFYVCYSCYENDLKGCFSALDRFKRGVF